MLEGDEELADSFHLLSSQVLAIRTKTPLRFNPESLSLVQNSQRQCSFLHVHLPHRPNRHP